MTTLDTADSSLKASRVSHTRRAHEATAAALYVLMCKAYNAYKEGVEEGEEPKLFSDWRNQAELESPQFHYWSLIIIINNNFIDLYCANINPENFHLRITLLNKILKS